MTEHDLVPIALSTRPGCLNKCTPVGSSIGLPSLALHKRRHLDEFAFFVCDFFFKFNIHTETSTNHMYTI